MHEHLKNDAEIHNNLLFERLNTMHIEIECLKGVEDQNKLYIEDIARLKAGCTCKET